MRNSKSKSRACPLTAAKPLATMRPMLVRSLLIVVLTFLAAACSSLRQGTVVLKKARSGLANAFATHLSFRYREPSVYWVRLEGRDSHGRAAHKNVILFRHDWEQLRVGDHWSRDRGFLPAEAGEK